MIRGMMKGRAARNPSTRTPGGDHGSSFNAAFARGFPPLFPFGPAAKGKRFLGSPFLPGRGESPEIG